MLSQEYKLQSVTLKVLLALLAGAALHIAAWTAAAKTTCQGVGLGGTVCSGGLGVGGALVAYVIAFVGAPILALVILRKVGMPQAAVIALGSQLIAIVLTLLLFRPLFQRDIPGVSLLWEVTTQAVAVPATGIALARLLRRS